MRSSTSALCPAQSPTWVAGTSALSHVDTHACRRSCGRRASGVAATLGPKAATRDRARPSRTCSSRPSDSRRVAPERSCRPGRWRTPQGGAAGSRPARGRSARRDPRRAHAASALLSPAPPSSVHACPGQGWERASQTSPQALASLNSSSISSSIGVSGTGFGNWMSLAHTSKASLGRGAAKQRSRAARKTPYHTRRAAPQRRAASAPGWD